MKLHIITVGDELLIGQVIDTNSAWIGTELNHLGMSVDRIITISDEHDEIIKTLKSSSEVADVILMTGGLGPTKDDITKKAIADFLKVDMVFSQETFDVIEKIFEKWGRKTTPAHKEQCFMPSNAELLRNRMGTAPGMYFDDGNTIICSMPGVPSEMKSIMEHELLPKLLDRFPRKALAHRTILTVGEGESRIAERVNDFIEGLPENISFAFLPSLGSVRLRLTGHGEHQADLDQQLDSLQSDLQQLIPEFVYGFGKDTLENVVGQLLKDQQKTISLAESCTGGYLAHKFTSISGASAYFMGGVVAYDNAIKENLLNVRPETLKEHGAVSEATVKEMVNGALQLMGTDIALSVSGIAGPTGGTAEKPVGTIWFAVGDKEEIKTYKLRLGKNRIQNIQYASVAALNMIRKFLIAKKIM